MKKIDPSWEGKYCSYNDLGTVISSRPTVFLYYTEIESEPSQKEKVVLKLS